MTTTAIGSLLNYLLVDESPGAQALRSSLEAFGLRNVLEDAKRELAHGMPVTVQPTSDVMRDAARLAIQDAGLDIKALLREMAREAIQEEDVAAIMEEAATSLIECNTDAGEAVRDAAVIAVGAEIESALCEVVTESIANIDVEDIVRDHIMKTLVVSVGGAK